MNSCDLKNTIKTLSELDGVSGYEHKNAEVISGMFKKYLDCVSVHTLGSVIGVRKNDFNIENPKKIMVEAHMDEIGLMVSDIDEDGFLKIVAIGGIDSRILLGMEVTVHGREDIVGIIGAKPPHVLTDDEKDTALTMDKLYIDTGYSKQRVKELVSIGDTVTFLNEFLCLFGDFVSTKAQDDRSSIAVLLMVMENLKNLKLKEDIYFVATTQEEVGLRGAKVASYSINPDCAIAIDVCHGQTPDASKSDAVACSSGTVVTVGPNIDRRLVNILMDAMKAKNVNFTIEVAGGDTGTDAWAIQISREGIPTVLLSLPLKYMHTPVETLSISDIKSTADGICAFLEVEKWS